MPLELENAGVLALAKKLDAGDAAFAELRTLRRLFERDDTAKNRETHRNGSGVRVFITHKTYARIVSVLERA